MAPIAVMHRTRLKPLIQAMRIPFLGLTPVCVLLGASTVMAEIDPQLFVLVLLGAMCAHISVNTLNEYFDFKSGLDLMTRKTPFSGGSGALPRHPELAGSVLTVAFVSLSATTLIGIYFILERGAGILPLGMLGLIIILSYTEWINRYPYICLVAPGIGFGLLMVLGTQYALQGAYTIPAVFAAAVSFLLVNNLLLLNQYPDVEADMKVGRRHFPIAYGTKRSSVIYGLSALLALVAVIAAIVSGYFPKLSLVALLPIPLAFFVYRGAVKYGPELGSHPQYLSANVCITILVPLLLAISLIYG